jgi:hypothetical protein
MRGSGQRGAPAAQRGRTTLTVTSTGVRLERRGNGHRTGGRPLHNPDRRCHAERDEGPDQTPHRLWRTTVTPHLAWRPALRHPQPERRQMTPRPEVAYVNVGAGTRQQDTTSQDQHSLRGAEADPPRPPTGLDSPYRQLERSYLNGARRAHRSACATCTCSVSRTACGGDCLRRRPSA